MGNKMERQSEQHGLKKRKVIFLLPSLIGGGAQHVASLLFPHFSRCFDLTVVLLEDKRVYDVPANAKMIALSRHLNGQYTHLLRIPQHLVSLIDVVKCSGTEVVLSFMEEANILNILSSRITRHRAIISQRIVPRLQHQRKGLLGALIYTASRFLYPKAAHLLSVSSQLRDIMVKDFGLMPERVSFVPNPIDLESMAREARKEPNLRLPERYFLHVGRLDLAHKGQDVLIRAFATLREQLPNLSLVLAGDGPDKARVENLVAELGLSDRVILVGWKENVACLMSRAEAFVLSSRYEGWPNALVEAMACGCPVIASDCESGPREILDKGRCGVLVPTGDEGALAEALKNLIENGTSREKLSRRAGLRVKQFALPQIAMEYSNLINDQLSSTTKTRLQSS